MQRIPDLFSREFSNIEEFEAEVSKIDSEAQVIKCQLAENIALDPSRATAHMRIAGIDVSENNPDDIAKVKRKLLKVFKIINRAHK